MDVSNLPVQLGATGVLIIVFLMVMKGKLVPRSVHEDRIKDKVNEIEYWKTAYQTSERRNGELVKQVGTLMEVAATAEHVLTALPVPAHDGSRNEVASP